MLAVDIGNTHTVLGVFREDRIAVQWRLTTRPKATVDEIHMRVTGLMELAHIEPEALAAAVIATVVPSTERSWPEALARLIPGPVSLLTPSNCGFPVEYSAPEQIGPDRLANALGVLRLGISDAIVIDLGTATTLDVVRGGAYLGGAICPGIETGMLALSGRTARLPQISLQPPTHAVGRTTESALASGLMLGHIGQIEYLVARIREEENLPHARVLATGGWSSFLGGRSAVVDEVHPDLTLEGLEFFSRRLPKS